MTVYVLFAPEAILIGSSNVISAVSHHSPLVTILPTLLFEFSGSAVISKVNPPFASNSSPLSKLIGNPIGFSFQK